jgi:hypothetical protein
VETHLESLLIGSSHLNGVDIPVSVKKFFRFGPHIVCFFTDTFL